MGVVFDTVGGNTFQRSFSTLKKGGFLVTAGAFLNDGIERHGVRVGRVQCEPNAGQLGLIRELVEAGKLKPHVATVFPFAKLKEAFELSESNHTDRVEVWRVMRT